MDTIISPNGSERERADAPHKSTYGRCVYHCDNDLVDHQVVNAKFSNEVTASFTMCAFTRDCSRTIKLMGTRAEIRGHTKNNVIETLDLYEGTSEVVHPPKSRYGHNGGDSCWTTILPI